MSKEFNVNLSQRQLFDCYLFLRGTVKPKDMDEVENLASLFKTFGLNDFREKVAGLKDGDSLKATDFDTAPSKLVTGSVDLKNFISYLKNLNGAVDIEMALRLRDIHDELVRARDHKDTALASV